MAEATTRLFSCNDVAEFCGVSAKTVGHWLDSGRLQNRISRGERQICVVDLLEFMHQNHLAIPLELMGYQQRSETLPSALVVDAHQGTANNIEQVLSSMSLKVTTVTNGFDATISYIQQKPQLLTLDLSIGDMSGVEFIENIIATQAHRAKILVISDGMPSSIEKARAAGANAVIAKPIDTDALKRSVRILLNL